MGLNAQTIVPVFTAAQVLTSAQMTQVNTGIPVFATTTTRDAAFGGAGEKTLAQGQFCYLESTGKLQVYTGSAWSNVGSQRNVATFTTSGTWTVPAGVTYAVATIRGGGGCTATSGATAGGNSSVAFASGTITATGGNAVNHALATIGGAAGVANSGAGGRGGGLWAGASQTSFGAAFAGDGALITAGATVTPAATITVTVGNGGTGSTNVVAGGSGYVFIEYEV